MSIPRFLFRISIVVAAALLVAAAGACSGPSVSVIRQATPIPLIGIKRYALAPVTWDGLTWNNQPEAAWLVKRNPECLGATFATPQRIACTTCMKSRAGLQPTGTGIADWRETPDHGR